MAQNTAQMAENDEPVMIEEQVDTGLKSLLANYRSPHALGTDKTDKLNNRFTLFPNRPLPHLSHSFATAYEASDNQNDERPIYALVCDNAMPYRQNAIAAMTGQKFPTMQSLQGTGTVQCSHLGEARMVLFVERPRAASLADHLNTHDTMHEHRVLDHVLGPAIKALLSLHEMGISHGHIRPGNFYMGEEPMLGECFSAPCGSLTPHLYEPPERMLADPLGRGEANEKSDCYALGVLAYELIYGLDKLPTDPEEFIRRSLEVGNYHVFANNREFSDTFQDFFRGVLAENPAERWGYEQLQQWLGGKRFNMIAPAPPKEAGRPLTFMGKNYFGGRLLAHVFHTNWRESAKQVKSLKLDRWCEMSLHRPEMAERIERALRLAGEASTERHTNDMMTRIISILDPVGPIRNIMVNVRPDGIGTMLAKYAHDTAAPELNHLLSFIETDIAGYWIDLADFNKLYDQPAAAWKLQKARSSLKMRAFGFGLERVLYDLNPSLTCQSDLLKPFHVTSANDVLKALDALAQNVAPDKSFMDRHLAAFVASKIDIGKEIRLHDLSTIPALADNPELVVLKILAKAQQKNERLSLVGLCTWAAMRIEKMLDEIHNRVMRREIKLELKKLAGSGSLNDLLNAIVNRDMALRDHDGFAKAIALHQINHHRIQRYQNPKTIEQQAAEMGGRMSSTIGFIILSVTLLLTISDIMSL